MSVQMIDLYSGIRQRSANPNDRQWPRPWQRSTTSPATPPVPWPADGRASSESCSTIWPTPGSLTCWTASGARLAVEHLISLGHRDIAYLAAPTGSAVLRTAAYLQTMADHGLQEHVRVEQTDMTELSGFRAMTRIMDSGRTPTAVVATNDILAVGALSAADDRSLGVPAELSLVGYNTHIAGIRHLSLSSVDPVSREVGIRAAHMLVERMADPSLPQRKELLTPRLVVRGSTAPPRRD